MSQDSRTNSVLSICDDALALAANEREQFVSSACGEDALLRQSVDSVLQAIPQAGEFLLPDSDAAPGAEEIIGGKIGSYRLIEKLGEGGMGSVYLASREHEDYTQQVALKMVRGRFLANELIRRFDAERKILARLNHPYIAALIDGISVNLDDEIDGDVAI
jgi:serine/threonine protein kinase